MEADASAIEEWKQLQAELVQKERGFADLALLHARGDITAAQLDQERRGVELLRDMARVAFDRMLFQLRIED